MWECRQSHIGFVATKMPDVTIEGRAGKWHYAVRLRLLDVSLTAIRIKVSLLSIATTHPVVSDSASAISLPQSLVSQSKSLPLQT